MIIGEDRSKVQNIVKPNVPYFQKLYSNILQDCPQVVYKHHLGRLEIDKSPEGQFTQLMALPRSLQQKITSLVDPPGKNRDVEEILLQVAHDPDCGLVVHQGISGIVRSSSIVQSAKTILTAGAKKSVTYSMKKLYKMTKGWLKKTSWVLTRYVWVNKRYLSSKCFAGVAEPTCKDESLLKKPVWIPFLSIFTTAVGFFY